MLRSLFGLPIRKIALTLADILRSHSLLATCHRHPPQWPDAFGPSCQKRDLGKARDTPFLWVLAANRRLDLVRSVLATLGARPAVQRPSLLVVVTDPSVGDDYRHVAADWLEIFGVPFELVLPHFPPSPDGLLAFAEKRRGDGTVLLSPAQIFGDDDAWYEHLARAAQDAPSGIALGSAPPAGASAWAQVPTLCWTRPPEKPWPDAGGAQLRCAPSVVHPLPRPSTASADGRALAWLYGKRERLFELAGQTLASVGWPKYGLVCEVECCALIQPTGYLVTGWIADPANRLQRLYLIHSPSDSTFDLTRSWTRTGKPEADKAFRYVSLPEPPRGFSVLVPAEGLVGRADAAEVHIFCETKRAVFHVHRGAEATPSVPGANQPPGGSAFLNDKPDTARPLFLLPPDDPRELA